LGISHAQTKSAAPEGTADPVKEARGAQRFASPAAGGEPIATTVTAPTSISAPR
jgi:hypothetical protein